jgi:hypothetical protein
MRDEILDYINGLSLGTYTVSNNLPYTDAGQALYIKNVKTIYVDQPTYEEEPILNTLNNQNVVNQVASVSIFYSTDAKALPANFDTLTIAIKNAKNITTIQARRRESDVNETYEGDLLVSEIEVRFIKITTT